MQAAARVIVAFGYTFAAWLLAALLVYAGSSLIPRRFNTFVRLAALALTFAPIFKLYFKGAWPLPPLGAAAAAVAFIAALDLVLIAPYFTRRYDLFLSFWEWQGPALLVAGTIYVTGRSAESAPARI